jgi:hypothetical protein
MSKLRKLIWDRGSNTKSVIGSQAPMLPPFEKNKKAWFKVSKNYGNKLGHSQ